MRNAARATPTSRAARAATIIAALSVLAPAGAGAAPMGPVAPFSSFHRLAAANGFAPIVYDASSRRLVSFRENMYRYPAPGLETRDLAFDCYLGLGVGGASGWLTDTPLDEVGYEVGTGLIRTVQTARGLRVTTTYTAPFGLDARAFLVVAELENTGPDVSRVSLFTLHNFHTGGGSSQTAAERIRWHGGAYLESSDAPDAPRGTLVVRPLGPVTHHTASPANPFPLVQAGRPLPDVDDSGVTDDAVSGFQVDLGTLAHGSTAAFAFVVGWAPDHDADGLVARIDAYAAGRTPAAILEGERAGWRGWIQAGRILPTLAPAETRVALQSLAVLRMAQVREPGAPAGAILASLPPGRWDMCWLRDTMFAVAAFQATGHWPEAQAALDFVLRGPVGAYASYVGRPYGLSIARYFGSGQEESDSNAQGPNIELDGFGLFLLRAANHALNSPDPTWYAAHRATIDALVADVLIADRDPETGLVAADSSIWESHWTAGGRQRWAFTSGMAAAGLAAWAQATAGPAAAGSREAPARARAGLAAPSAPARAAAPATAGATPNAAGEAMYLGAARDIRAAILAHLLDANGAIAASVEQRSTGAHYADAQAAFLLNADVVSATSAIGRATLDLLESQLFLTATGHGFERNDDGGAYDAREWIVIDLAMSEALRRAGRAQEAGAILGWVTSEADLNDDLLPELLDRADASYAGETPMVGFGAGAYLLALAQRAQAAPAPPPGSAGAGAGAEAPGDGADAGAVITPPAGGPALDAAAGPDAAASDAGLPEGADAGSAGPGAPERPAANEGCGCSATRDHPATRAALLPSGVILAALSAARGARRRPVAPERRRRRRSPDTP